MEELISQITTRTGISEDQARQAVGMVVEFGKSKLPEPIASQFDALLGGSAGGSMADQLQQGLGNLFGGQS
jgi:hypothetical protein